METAFALGYRFNRLVPLVASNQCHSALRLSFIPQDKTVSKTRNRCQQESACWRKGSLTAGVACHCERVDGVNSRGNLAVHGLAHARPEGTR